MAQVQRNLQRNFYAEQFLIFVISFLGNILNIDRIERYLQRNLSLREHN